MYNIYALKEILENHRSQNGSMFMGFLDASKAFDRLKHTTLFRKLIDRRVPNYIVRIIMYCIGPTLIKQCVYDGLELCRKAFM